MQKLPRAQIVSAVSLKGVLYGISWESLGLLLRLRWRFGDNFCFTLFFVMRPP